jgi:NodT family efflux transporter outer membrane factor (OMF) lipoprotein
VLLLAGMLTAAAACRTPPEPDPLPFEEAPAFSVTDGVARADRWWQSLADEDLDRHIERGLAQSFTLRAAYERLRTALALAQREGAALEPTLDAFAGVTLRDIRGNAVVGLGNQRQTQHTLGLATSYELDLWGRIRANLAAAEFEASATAEDFQAAAVGLSAQIAVVAYRLTESKAQLALIESQLQTNRRVLAVIENRFAIGQSNGADVLRQRQLVEATNGQRILEATSAEVLAHQLAVLVGDQPQRETLTPPDVLPTLPPLPAVGLPSELLQRRPDVRAAYLRLESADRAVAAAVRDQYPRLDLSASISASAGDLSELLSAYITQLGAQLAAPLLDGGRRRSEVDRTVAVRHRRLAEYGDAVLLAFQEVEDALALERRQAERIDSLQRQLQFADATYTELRNQYLNGAADFIDVLVALRDQQGLERSVLDGRLLRVEARIALHRAIAGGFAEAPQGAADAATEATP